MIAIREQSEEFVFSRINRYLERRGLKHIESMFDINSIDNITLKLRPDEYSWLKELEPRARFIFAVKMSKNGIYVVKVGSKWFFVYRGRRSVFKRFIFLIPGKLGGNDDWSILQSQTPDRKVYD